MENNKRKSILADFGAYIFGACMLIVATELLLYLCGFNTGGLAFLSGVVGIIFIALCSAIFGNGRHKIEEILTLGVAFIFFGWILVKALK